MRVDLPSSTLPAVVKRSSLLAEVGVEEVFEGCAAGAVYGRGDGVRAH